MKNDQDIVKAVGFVALYAAYVEESVDIVMERLSSARELKDSQWKWPTSRKIDWCIETLQSLDNNGLKMLVDLLGRTKIALERRNEVIHGRIYSGHDRSDHLRSGRPNVPVRTVTAHELGELAEELFKLQAAVPNINLFATLRAVHDRA